MKINKKVLIPLFATAMGLSAVGGISGAVAWYQYNSRVTASYIGASVADTGVLQIGTKATEQSAIAWGRDVNFDKSNLVPATFGAMGENNALPSNAYAYPEAGCGEGYTGHSVTDHTALEGWASAEKGKHYAQFKFYLRAYETDPAVSGGYKLVARKVYLTDLILKTVTSQKSAEEALRVHIKAGNSNFLISNTEHSSSSPLDLYGGLDLDKNGHNDKYHATAFNDNLASYGNHPADREGNIPGTDPAEPLANSPFYDGEEMIYGVYGQTQVTSGKSGILAQRDTDGKIKASDASKALFTTSTDEANPVEVTVTVWLEGWELLKPSANGDAAVLWNPEYNAGCDLQVGLRFDTGIFREADLNQQ